MINLNTHKNFENKKIKLNTEYVVDLIKNNNIGEIKNIINKHNINTITHKKTTWKNSLLILAIQENKTQIVRYFLKIGGDINYTNNYNNTPLMFASTTKNQKIFNMILLATPKTIINNINDGGDSALLINSTNIDYGLHKIISLIQHGADWNIINNNGDDFLDNITDKKIKKQIFTLFPNQYENYLMFKKLKEYNI